MRRVLFVGSDVCGWAEIHRLVCELPIVQIVGETRCAAEAQLLAEKLLPNCIIVPDRIEQESCLRVLRRISDRGVRCRSIVLASGPECITDLSSFHEVSLSGLLVWTSMSADTFRHCLSLAICGEVAVYSVAVAEAMRGSSYQNGTSNARLTPREQTVLEMIADGYSDRLIAERASLGLRTVERLVSDLKVKLNATRRADLSVRAVRLGLLTGMRESK